MTQLRRFALQQFVLNGLGRGVRQEGVDHHHDLVDAHRRLRGFERGDGGGGRDELQHGVRFGDEVWVHDGYVLVKETSATEHGFRRDVRQNLDQRLRCGRAGENQVVVYA